MIDYCESPPEFITDTDDVDIEWDEPIFHDNSRENPTIVQSHKFGKFKFGETEVSYVASDSSGNSVECKIIVSLQSLYSLLFLFFMIQAAQDTLALFLMIR